MAGGCAKLAAGRSGPPRTGCARPSSTSSARRAASRACRVVDLFCGSGALGVEALSRGAASVTFVDHDPGALAAVRQNLAAVGPGRRAGHRGAGRAARLAGAGAPGRSTSPCATRPTTSRTGRRCSARCRPTLVVLESSAPIDARPRAGWSRESAGTAVRSSPWLIAAVDRLVKVGLFPGSFDPFHNGHLEIVERASRLFDEVVVAALRNPQKSAAALRPRRAPGDARGGRGAPARRAHRLGVDAAGQRGPGRGRLGHRQGLRAVSDFETEMQMAQMNNHLSGVETIFIPTSSTYSFIASQAGARGGPLRRRRLGLRPQGRGQAPGRRSSTSRAG